MDFGKVTVNGKEYQLKGEADFTNRLLDGRYTNYQDAAIGEEYDVEFSAPAIDSEGNEVTIYWMFRFIKGQEPELDSLDWDNPERVHPN